MFFILKNVAVFFGGQSIEHEISCITGTLTANSIDQAKYVVYPVYIDHDAKWWTGELLRDIDFLKNPDFKKLKRVTLFAGDNKLYFIKGKKAKPLCEVSVAINCVHGERGEDGSIDGILNLCGIALASPSMLSSSVSMSKSFTKIALKGLGVKHLPCVTVSKRDDYRRVESLIDYPLIVKPDTGGSSIGITVAKNRPELDRALSIALRYGEKAIVEPLVTDFIEINCACYRVGDDIRVSECERPVSLGEILSFDDKYQGGKRVFPADIEKAVSDKIKKTTQKVYEGLAFNGVIRVDYIVKGKEVYLNEINSVPGSLAYYLFVKTLKEFTSLLSDLIADALNRGARKSTVTKKFSSGILTATGSKGAKRLKN